MKEGVTGRMGEGERTAALDSNMRKESHCKGGIWMRHEGLKGERPVDILVGGWEDIPGRRGPIDKVVLENDPGA